MIKGDKKLQDKILILKDLLHKSMYNVLVYPIECIFLE